MQSARLIILAAVAVCALIMSVVALVEIYTPPKVIAIAPVGPASRITLLERKVAAQAEALRQLESTSAQAVASRTEADIRKLRDATQASLNQIGREMNSLRAQVARLEQANRNISPRAPDPRTATAQLVYLVQPGETLAAIATRFSVSEEAIKAANPRIADFTNLRAGQPIFVPITPNR